MNKDFGEKKLLSFTIEKQIRVLYDLAQYIEQKSIDHESSSFQKLSKYHTFLVDSSDEKIQKLNKEFNKVKQIDYQFQVYLMNLERLLGQSTKDYDFLVTTDDQNNKTKTFPIVCILDSVRSAHNVGAMFRNAECFGAENIILCGLAPTPENLQVQKTAMGCDHNIRWEYNKSAHETVSKLKIAGYTIWSIETSNNSILLEDINDIPAPLAIIFGHEQFGVSKELIELSDEIVSISLFGKKNSLNVSVSQGIVLNHLVSQSKQS